jgi:DNA-binding MarR family transcriptional regulator
MGAYSKNRKDESLLHLSEEIGRIAGTLAQLSTVPSFSRAEPAPSEGVPQVAAETVRAVIRARHLRGRYFSQDLFADPAWDIMLDLLCAELCNRRVAVSSLCLAAAVPATTALRWMKSMEKQGLIIRHNDPLDGRRVFIELAPATSLALHQYFAELDKPKTI